MLIHREPIQITREQLVIATSFHIAKHLKYRLKDINKVFGVDKKILPSATSCRFTVDPAKLTKTELNRFKVAFHHSMTNPNGEDTLIRIAYDIAIEVLNEIPEMKSKWRRMKFENMINNNFNALSMFFYVTLLYTYKMYYTMTGTTGSLYFDKRFELMEINKYKISKLARMMTKGEISESEFYQEYGNLISIFENNATLNLTRDELDQLEEESGLYRLIGSENIEQSLNVIVENVRENVSGQIRLLDIAQEQHKLMANNLLGENNG